MATRRPDEKKFRPDRVSTSCIRDVVVMAFIPLVLDRVAGFVGVAVFSVPLMFTVAASLCAELFWERPCHRIVRILLQSEKYEDAAVYRRKLSAVAFLAGVLFALSMVWVYPFLFGDTASRAGSRWIMLIALPGIAFTAASGAPRGYLRARGADAGLAISRAMFRVLMLILPCILGIIGMRYGKKVDALLMTDRYASVYSAVGAMAGMSLAAIAVWIELAAVTFVFRTSGIPSPGKTRGRNYSYFSSEGFVPLLLLILYGADMRVFFSYSMPAEGEDLLSGWGRWFGIGYAPMLLVSGLVLLPFVIYVYRVHARCGREDYPSARGKLAGMVRHVMILSLPAAAFVCALAVPVVSILAGKPDDAGTICLRLQMIGVPFAVFAVLFALLLSKIGGMRAVWVSVLIGTAVHAVVLILMGRAGKGVYACITARLAGIAATTLLLAFLLSAMLSYRQELIHGFAVPFICTAVAAAPMAALGAALPGVIGEVLTVIFLAVPGGILYLILLSVFRGLAEYELYKLPGGGALVTLSRIFGR